MKKIIRILRSKLRNKSEIKDEFYLERIEVCKDCPLNSKNIKGKFSIKYKILKFLNLGEDFCTLCGCEIRAKASEEIETCPENKWKKLI